MMYDLTGFQRDLPYAIVGLNEPHELATKDELETYYEKEIHHGRLYPDLDTLADKGVVEKGEKDRRTNVYSITRRGTREIEARRGVGTPVLGRLIVRQARGEPIPRTVDTIDIEGGRAI